MTEKEMEDILKVSFRAIILEADEWRPLVRYINDLLAHSQALYQRSREAAERLERQVYVLVAQRKEQDNKYYDLKERYDNLYKRAMDANLAPLFKLAAAIQGADPKPTEYQSEVEETNGILCADNAKLRDALAQISLMENETTSAAHEKVTAAARIARKALYGEKK